MLLVIRNLPTKTRYSEVKALIKDRCGVADVILDNLIYEEPQSRKVTVGVHNENDAGILLKELNGLNFMGQKLSIEVMRQTKEPVANQGYSKEYGSNMNQNNMRGVQSTSNMHSNTLSANQGSGYQYEATMGQDLNDATLQAQYMAFCNSITGSGYGAPDIPTNQNTNMAYNGPPNFDNNQPPLANSNDFIPLSAEKSSNDPYNNKNQGGSRYFQKKDDGQYPSNDRQSFGEPARDSSDRSKRMPPVWNERETFQPRNRSDFSNERRFDDWNGSRDFSGRSGDDSSHPRAINNRCGESFSDKNPRQAGGAYSRSHEGSYNRSNNRFGDEYSRRSDSDYCHGSNDGNFRPNENNISSGRYDKSSMHSSGSNYNRSKDRRYGQTDNNPRSYLAGPKHNEFGYANRKTAQSQRHVPKYISNKTPYSRNNDFKESRIEGNAQIVADAKRKETSNAPPPKSYKNSTESMKNKDETWRGQATAAIAKDLLIKCGKPHLIQKPSFLTFLKTFIRSRINDLIGKRESVPLNQMIEEYHQRYKPANQKSFLIDIIKKSEMSPPSEGQSKNNWTDTGNNQFADAKGAKRAGSDNLGSKPAKKPKTQEDMANVLLQKKVETPQGPLPKYPNADKIEYKKIKRLGKMAYEDLSILNLSPDLQKAIDEEVLVLCDLFTDECKNPEDKNEQSVAKRIMSTVEEFKKVLTVDLGKRILNITCNLPLRIYIAGKPKINAIDHQLKELGIVSIRKSRAKKFFIASCQTYESYDRLCAMEKVEIDGCILTIKPLHMGMTTKKNKNNEKNSQEDDNEHVGDEKGARYVEHAGDDDDASDVDEGDDEEEAGDEGDDIGDSNTYNVDDAGDNDNTADVIEVKYDSNELEVIEDTEDVICINDSEENITGDASDKTQVKEKNDENNTADASNDNRIEDTTEQNYDKHNPDVPDIGKTNTSSVDITNITEDDLEDF